jgi:hypothetical protein
VQAAQSAPSICSLASPAKVKSALGFGVGAPIVTKNGPVTVCQYVVKTGLIVRFETSETAAMFAFGQKSFATHGEKTKPVSGVGAKAYTSTIGKVITLVVLQGKTELLITASQPLPRLETLAKLIVPSL